MNIGVLVGYILIIIIKNTGKEARKIIRFIRRCIPLKDGEEE